MGRGKKPNFKSIVKSVGRTISNAVKDPKGSLRSLGKLAGKLAQKAGKLAQKLAKKIVDLCPVQLIILNRKNKLLERVKRRLAKEHSRLTGIKNTLTSEKNRLTFILDELKREVSFYTAEINSNVQAIQQTEGFIEGKKNLKKFVKSIGDKVTKVTGKSMTPSQCRARKSRLSDHINGVNTSIRKFRSGINELKNVIIPTLYREIAELKKKIPEYEREVAILKEQLYGNKKEIQLGYIDVLLRKFGKLSEVSYLEEYSNISTIYETNISNSIVEGMGTELETLIKQNIAIENEIDTNRQKHSVDNSSVFYQTKQHNTQQLYSLIFMSIFYIFLLCLGLFLFFFDNTMSKRNKTILLTVLALYPFYILYLEFAIYYVLYFFYTYSFGIPFDLSYKNVVDFWITIIQVVAV